MIAQTRLGGGRIHHAMRTVGMCQRAFDMMCERALSAARRRASCSRKKQMVQETIADSWIELQQFRLQVLHAAWMIDQVGGHKARTEIAVVKVRDAEGAARHRVPGDAPARLARHVERDAAHRACGRWRR